MSMRSGASVSQLRAESVVPRGARMSWWGFFIRAVW